MDYLEAVTDWYFKKSFDYSKLYEMPEPFCNQRVGGSNPSLGSKKINEGWLKKGPPFHKKGGGDLDQCYRKKAYYFNLTWDDQGRAGIISFFIHFFVSI